MMSIMLLLTVVVSTMNPMNMSILLVMMSVLSAVYILSKSSSSFLPSALVISFSSGMMIMFCYCSMFSTHEKKSQNMNLMMIISGALLFIMSSDKMKEDLSQMSMTYSTHMQFLSLAMLLVVISMLSINKNLNNKKNSLMTSY